MDLSEIVETVVEGMNEGDDGQSDARRKTGRDMTVGSPTRHIFAFSIPLLLGNIFQQFYNMVDSIVVGNYVGKQALAAVGTSFPVIFLINSLFMGVGMGATIMLSQYFGARDQEKIRRTVDTLYISTFIAALIITALGVMASGPLLRIMQTPEDIMPDAQLYLNIIFLGTLASLGYNVFSSILQGVGNTKTPLYFLIISTIVNVVLDLVFVLVFHWDVMGVALATIIAQGVAFIYAFIHIRKHHPMLAFHSKNIQFDTGYLKRFVHIGLPAGIQNMLFSLGNITIQGLINSQGENFMAGFTAASKIDFFVFMPIMTIGNAISTFTGQNIGAGKMERISNGYKSSLLLSCSMTVVLSGGILLFGQRLIRLFNQDAAVIESGMAYLVRLLPFYVILAVLFMSNGVARGAGATTVPLYITIMSFWLIRIPSAYLLTWLFGANEMWFGYPLGWLLGAIVSVIYYRSGRWKNKAVIRQA